MNRIALALGIALAVLVVLAAPAMAGPNTVYFVPQESSASPGEITYVELWLNLTDEEGDVNPNYGFKAADINITLDKETCDIIEVNRIPGDPWDLLWQYNLELHDGLFLMCQAVVTPPPPIGMEPGLYPIANLTIQANNSGVTNLHFSHELPRRSLLFDSGGNEMPNQVWNDGTFTCGGGETPETFTKSLPEGWNLISLPLTPTDNSVIEVLDTVSYSDVRQYNAATHQFEDATTMDPGTGYFVNVTTAGTWVYEGEAYTSMTESLSDGLNCIGWVNETGSALPGALSSIDGSYWYVSRWSANTQGYEVYNPDAPDVFNDFETMDRGEGYFISATDGCTLVYP